MNTYSFVDHKFKIDNVLKKVKIQKMLNYSIKVGALHKKDNVKMNI